MIARNIATPFAALLLAVNGAVFAAPSSIAARSDPSSSCTRWFGHVDEKYFATMHRGWGISTNLYFLQDELKAWYYPTEKRVFLTQENKDAKETVYQVQALDAQGRAASYNHVIKIDGTQGCNLSIPQADHLDVKVFIYYGR